MEHPRILIWSYHTTSTFYNFPISSQDWTIQWLGLRDFYGTPCFFSYFHCFFGQNSRFDFKIPMLSTAILGNIPNIEKKCHVKVTPVMPRHSRKTIEMDISPHVFHMFINFSRLLVCDLEHLGMWTSPAFPSQNHEKTVPRIRTNPLKRTVIYPNSTLKYCNIYICVIIYVCIYIYNISIAKSTKFNLQSKHLQISSFSHDRSRVRRRPESVERHLERSHCPALRPCDRQWCEPSMGQSSRGPASPWLFFGPIPSKRSYTYGLYIYIYPRYPRYPRPSQDGIYSWNIDIWYVWDIDGISTVLLPYLSVCLSIYLCTLNKRYKGWIIQHVIECKPYTQGPCTCMYDT